MTYLVLDIETDSKTTFRKWNNPFDPNNKIIMVQGKRGNTDVKIIFDRTGIDRDITLNLDSIDLLVGHNLSYDLSYLWYNTSIQSYLKRGGKIWDTLLVEYLLDGQLKQPRDLSSLSVKYGGTAKIDVVTEAFKNGKGWDSIADDVALEYGKDDIVNTEALYLNQVKRVKENRMESIVEIYNKHALLVINAEVNGLHVDLSKLSNNLNEHLEAQLGYIERLNQTVKGIAPREIYYEFNLDSNDHIRSLLFNTPFKMVVDEPKLDESGEPLRYKSGTRKGNIVTKKIKKEFYINPEFTQLKLDFEAAERALDEYIRYDEWGAFICYVIDGKDYNTHSSDGRERDLPIEIVAAKAAYTKLHNKLFANREHKKVDAESIAKAAEEITNPRLKSFCELLLE